MFKKWIAMLLCLAMVLSLWACGKQEPAETTETTQPTETETTTESTAPPEPTAFDLFNSVREPLLALDTVTLITKATDTRTVGDETYTITENTTARYTGLKGELLAELDADIYFESETRTADKRDFTQRFAGGNVYATYQDSNFREEISAQDFLARQIPLDLFRAENFGKAELSRDGKTIRFSEATAMESWIAPDYAEFVSAEASAILTMGKDALTALTYTATFRQGAALVTLSYEVNINTLDKVELSAEAPADADTYALVDSVELPLLMEQASFNLSSTSAKSTQLMQVITSQAAAYGAQLSHTISEYGTGSDYKVKIEGELTEITQQGQQTTKTEEIFSNGTYSYYADGELANQTAFDADSMAEILFEMVMEYIIPGKWLTEATLTHVGDGLFIEFASDNQEGRDYFKDITMYEIFREDTVLDDMASAYEHKTLSGYMGIDLDTMTPTSYYVDFQGEHTIQGSDFLLSQQITCAYTAPDSGTYKEITGEELPETEPTEKASPVFYRVTGANGEEMWLLGTIHLGDERTGFLPKEVYDAFDASDALAVEFDMNAATRAMEDPEFVQKIATLMLYTDGTTIENHMEPELYEAAVLQLKYIGEYTPTVVEMMKVAMWENVLSNYMVEGHAALTPNKGVDQRLLDRAEAAGKEILNVESMESQMSMLMGFSDDLQCYLLEQALNTSRHEYIGDVEELYELWCSGDETALRDMINSDDSEVDPSETALAKEYEEAMHTNRDKAMVETAKGYLTSGKTVFYAVGLAHLLKDNGLVDSLRAAGYTVELVTYAN